MEVCLDLLPMLAGAWAWERFGLSLVPILGPYVLTLSALDGFVSMSVYSVANSDWALRKSVFARTSGVGERRPGKSSASPPATLIVVSRAA